jgi:hypothetical protein
MFRPARFRPLLTILLSAGLVAVGCGDCGEPEPEPEPSDAGADADVTVVDVGPADAARDMADDLPDDMGPTATRVEIELGPYLVDSPLDDGGDVRVFQAEGPGDLVDGAVASGRAGDWVLENDVARFVVEGDVRAMSACPYGGHLIDGAPVDIESDGDSVGEICLFVNAGSTLVPENFEILHDGSDGGPGVLAVSGPLHLHDWINFTTMAADLGFGAIGELAIGPNTIPPVYATVYYILRPGERGVRTVTAVRNDGDAQTDLFIGHLLGGGGDGSYWNPLSSKQGYGTAGLSLDTLEGEPMPWVGYGGGNDSSWAYVPRPNPGFDDHAIPVGGAYLAVSGIVVTAPDIDNILQLLIATEAQIPTHPALVHLQPGETAVKEHWTFVGDGSHSTWLDQAYTLNEVPTGTVTGEVRDAAGELVDGALVTAIGPEGGPLAQARTEAGQYSMKLPAGLDYSLRARVGNLAATPYEFTMGDGATEDAPPLSLPEPATVVVHVRNPDGEPVPGRVTVVCDADECPGRPTQQEVDLDTDSLPELWAGVFYADVATGDTEFQLPPGDYRVVVSRGLAWSVWPEDSVPEGGFEVTAQSGETSELDAEIAPVVDMTGLLSADFHVHTLASHDSNTPHLDRVRGFVSDGLDVAVSSDHDNIVDYAPAVAELGATQEIATVVGLEITTSDIGHFNGFPLELDPDHKRGGALDWAGGIDLSLTPEEIFQWVDGHPDEQVVQVNHADSLGLFKNIIADPLRGISLVDPSLRRLPPAEPDPETGDTGLWSEAFTAYEVSNGNDLPQFWALFRWWLTMIGRGFSPTGTAVTDTHHRYSDVGSTPRSLVTVPEGSDTPATFDAAVLVDAVNAGKVVGTNGPVLRVALRNASDDRATYGEVLDGSSGEVTAEIEIQTPEWMTVDTIDVYTNEESVVGEPGQPNEDPVSPTSTVDVNLTPADLVDVAAGAERTHRRYQKTVEIPLTVNEDSYFVFIVRGEATGPMTPILRETETLPFAWTNPIFVDFDGNGYDDPPLADLASTSPPPTRTPEVVDTPVTAETVLQSLRENTCREHPH